MTGLIITLLVLAAIVPLAMLGYKLGRKNRDLAFAAAALLMLFGVNFNVSPPPPPRIEKMADEAEQDQQDEPK